MTIKKANVFDLKCGIYFEMLLNFAQWINEQETSEQTIIYLDLDHTLIDANESSVWARPGAEKFIEDCKKLAPTIIISHGKTHRQRLTVKKLGWNVEVLGGDDYKDAIKSKKSILVDDHPPTSLLTQAKIKAIGLIDPNRIITISAWKANQPEDDQLPKILNKIKELISTNEWTEKIIPYIKKQLFDDYDEAKNMAKARRTEFKKLLHEAAGKAQVLVDIKSENSFEDKVEKRGKKR